jgi:hypothetical protein
MAVIIVAIVTTVRAPIAATNDRPGSCLATIDGEKKPALKLEGGAR